MNVACVCVLKLGGFFVAPPICAIGFCYHGNPNILGAAVLELMRIQGLRSRREEDGRMLPTVSCIPCRDRHFDRGRKQSNGTDVSILKNTCQTIRMNEGIVRG